MSKNYNVKQVIVMRTDLKNTKGEKVRSGKLMAQAGHAAMLWLSKRLQRIFEDQEEVAEDGERDRDPAITWFWPDELEWLRGSFAKIVLGAGSEVELRALMLRANEVACKEHLPYEICIDNGATEFGGMPTVTCIAIGPARADLIDTITGHLKPL